MKIADRLKELMEERGMTMYSLAKASDVSWTTVKNLFNRTDNPTISTIELLCKGLGVTLSEFFAEEKPLLKSNELQSIIDAWDEISERDQQILSDMAASMKKNKR